MVKRKASETDRGPRKKTPEGAPKEPWRKPRLLVKSGDAAREARQEAEQHPVTVWTVLIRLLPVWALLIMVLILEPTLPLRAISSVIRLIGGVPPSALQGPAAEPVFIVEGAESVPVEGDLPPVNWDLVVAPVFQSEVLYWQPDILNWSQVYRIKPNLIATLMQIESCGDPTAESPTGSKGLFQVTNEHWQPGDDPFDPQTNAQRALTYFSEMYAESNGDLGKTFAAYNAGPWVIDASPAEWPDETQVYQFWATGIFEEAERGFSESPTLLDWLDAGGSDLCAQATVWQNQ